MLAKKFRFKIQEWLKEKRKITTRRSDFFIIKSRTNDLLFNRFGTIINGKVSRSAVSRNKIKRTIFNFIRLKKKHKQAGNDVLIIVLPQASGLTKLEIEKELEKILHLI